MTQTFPCPRLEAEFNRMFAATPKPEAPIPIDQEAGTTLAQPAPQPDAALITAEIANGERRHAE